MRRSSLTLALLLMAIAFASVAAAAAIDTRSEVTSPVLVMTPATPGCQSQLPAPEVFSLLPAAPQVGAPPHPAATIGCTQCQLTHSCYSCCRCNGGSVEYCGALCGPTPD